MENIDIPIRVAIHNYVSTHVIDLETLNVLIFSNAFSPPGTQFDSVPSLERASILAYASREWNATQSQAQHQVPQRDAFVPPPQDQDIPVESYLRDHPTREMPAPLRSWELTPDPFRANPFVRRDDRFHYILEQSTQAEQGLLGLLVVMAGLNYHSDLQNQSEFVHKFLLASLVEDLTQQVFRLRNERWTDTELHHRTNYARMLQRQAGEPFWQPSRVTTEPVEVQSSVEVQGPVAADADRCVLCLTHTTDSLFFTGCGQSVHRQCYRNIPTSFLQAKGLGVCPVCVGRVTHSFETPDMDGFHMNAIYASRDAVKEAGLAKVLMYESSSEEEDGDAIEIVEIVQPQRPLYEVLSERSEVEHTRLRAAEIERERVEEEKQMIRVEQPSRVEPPFLTSHRRDYNLPPSQMTRRRVQMRGPTQYEMESAQRRERTERKREAKRAEKEKLAEERRARMQQQEGSHHTEDSVTSSDEDSEDSEWEYWFNERGQ